MRNGTSERERKSLLLSKLKGYPGLDIDIIMLIM